MATNSILRSIYIKDKQLAKSFVIALESAQNKKAVKVIMSKTVKQLTCEQAKEIFG